ncbi:unnamed protein product [Calypogeia fissa]
MIRTLTLSGSRRSNNMMEGVLQVSSKSPNHHQVDSHSSLQAWQCDQESSEYDDGSPGNLLSAQVAAARLASSSSDSGPESDLLPPELHNLESGSSLLSNDVSSANPTANFLLPKSSIWGTGDSEYSWAQESLSRSSGSMDDTSLLSSDTLGNDASRLLETSKAGDSLMHGQWPLHNSPSATASMNLTTPLPPYQRRSWQSTSDDDHSSVGLLSSSMNGLAAYSHSFPALSSSSCLDASKFNMDYLAEERCMGNFEATSVYDSMARKIHNQMSGLDANSGSTNDLSSMGFSALQMGQTTSPGGLTDHVGSNNNVTNGLFLQQHKNSYNSISPMDHDKSYLNGSNSSRVFFNHNSPSSTLDTNAIMNSATTAAAASNQRFGYDHSSNNHTNNSPKLLLESLSGNSALNISPSSESVLGSHNYLYSTQKKLVSDPLESLRKWPANAAAGTGMKDFSVNNPSLGSLGRFPYTVTGTGSTLGAKEDHGPAGLYDSTWPLPTASVGLQSLSADVAPGDDSRKRFLQMSIGQRGNNSHKRLHMETQNGQAAVPPASLKRSSSWASSLTSTCSKDQDSSVTGSVLPHTKSSSRHAVGPALNTNLKPRARQGSANDPQSIAARVRRERISERLKVLQDLVPNGSKVDLVTMLEKAINYVKFLQLQVKVLTTDDYWPSNEKGAAPCTALPNFEDMEGALKVLVAQAEKEANNNTSNNNNSNNQQNNTNSGSRNMDKSSEDEEMESGSPHSSDST